MHVSQIIMHLQMSSFIFYVHTESLFYILEGLDVYKTTEPYPTYDTTYVP